MELIGRSSSHFTRLPRMLAEELGVPLTFTPIYDMTSLEPPAYGDHPALKFPVLRTQAGVMFGALNICRAIAEHSNQTRVVIWPEQLGDVLSRNAHELVWHCMSAQVQLVVGTQVAKLPADNLFFVKAQTGLQGGMLWLDAHMPEVRAQLPAERQLSIFELALFCLVTHLQFRRTIEIERCETLVGFAREFSARASARATLYRFD